MIKIKYVFPCRSVRPCDSFGLMICSESAFAVHRWRPTSRTVIRAPIARAHHYGGGDGEGFIAQPWRVRHHTSTILL